MPALIIGLEQNNWFCSVTNSDIRYKFNGASDELERINMNEFSLRMGSNDDLTEALLNSVIT